MSKKIIFFAIMLGIFFTLFLMDYHQHQYKKKITSQHSSTTGRMLRRLQTALEPYKQDIIQADTIYKYSWGKGYNLKKSWEERLYINECWQYYQRVNAIQELELPEFENRSKQYIVQRLGHTYFTKANKKDKTIELSYGLDYDADCNYNHCLTFTLKHNTVINVKVTTNSK